jgi:hypothetical protein
MYVTDGITDRNIPSEKLSLVIGRLSKPPKYNSDLTITNKINL